jgi:osmotically-inducible protein OsmY
MDQEGVGTLTGAERFIRGNRARTAFVGADQTEGQGFVGSQQARTSGTIVSSTAGMEPAPDQSQQINRPLTPAKAGQMYLPKIVVNVDNMSADLEAALSSSVEEQVQQAVNLVSPTGIAASVEGRTAILRGIVRSDEERRLAETLVSFEPGISMVRNLLQTPAIRPPEQLPLPPPVPSD